MTLAFLFAGQGSQKVGMGSELIEACDDCRNTFASADHALGFSLTRLMAEGPEQDLRRTAIAQPALLTLAVAQARHLMSMGVKPVALAGHSLGQYAALVIAGSLDFETAVRLVHERGRLMQAAVPEGQGAMMAIVGLDRDLVYQIVQETREQGVVTVALHNATGQTVISGEVDAVAAAAERCEEEGAGVVPLAVSVPFHCDLLTKMVPDFARLVDAAPVHDPRLPVIDNVTAQPLADAAAVRQSLVDQVTSPVLFEESLVTLSQMGVDAFVQCGPGKSVLGFASRTLPGVQCQTFEQAGEAVRTGA